MTRGMWITSCTGIVRGGFWGIWKSQLSFCGRTEKLSSWVGRRRLTFAGSPWPCSGCARGLGQMEKSGVSLTLCRKTFKPKGNKKFRTWTKKSSVFFVFRDSYVIYICALWTLWTFCAPVWTCLFHIFMYGYVTLPVFV